MSDLITDYEKHLRRLDRSPKTVAFYTRVLRQADRDLPMGLCSATTEELEDWLFTPSPNRRGGPQRGKTTRSHYSRILRGFGKWATDPKRPRLAVQELLGHSDIGMTRRYVETNRDRMAAAVASLPVAV